MSAGRYRVDASTWSRDHVIALKGWSEFRTDPGPEFAIDTADLIDTRDGRRYRDGAYRVSLIAGRAAPGWRGKTFRGESAWSAAERYATDAAWSALRAADESARHGGPV